MTFTTKSMANFQKSLAYVEAFPIHNILYWPVTACSGHRVPKPACECSWCSVELLLLCEKQIQLSTDSIVKISSSPRPHSLLSFCLVTMAKAMAWVTRPKELKMDTFFFDQFIDFSKVPFDKQHDSWVGGGECYSLLPLNLSVNLVNGV